MLFSSTVNKEREESKEEKKQGAGRGSNTSKPETRAALRVGAVSSSSKSSVSSSSSSSLTSGSTTTTIISVLGPNWDEDIEDKDFAPGDFDGADESNPSSVSTSVSDTETDPHIIQKVRPTLPVYKIDLLGKRICITFSDRVTTGLYKEGTKGSKHQVQGDHVLAYRLFEKGLEKSLRHIFPAAAYQQLIRFVSREKVIPNDVLQEIIEKNNQEILKGLVSKESRDKILKALEKLPEEEKKATAEALDAQNCLRYSVACSRLAENYLRHRNKKHFTAFLPISGYQYISKGVEARHVHEGIGRLTHQYHILSENLESISFTEQKGDEVRTRLIALNTEANQIDLEKDIAKNIFKLFFYPKVDKLKISEEKEDKESEIGNRTNNLHTLAKVIGNSLVTVFNIYPIFWYLKKEITKAFVQQVTQEGVVEIPCKKSSTGTIQKEMRPVHWGLDEKDFGKVLDEVCENIESACSLEEIGKELDKSVTDKKEAKAEELEEELADCLKDQESKEEKKEGKVTEKSKSVSSFSP